MLINDDSWCFSIIILIVEVDVLHMGIFPNLQTSLPASHQKPKWVEIFALRWFIF